ncbi:MAG: hypothetical protein KFH87_07565, partial [Bacteroidetes bacterium]|nr:hypothetical protein [Bacteroidota bacterium]
MPIAINRKIQLCRRQVAIDPFEVQIRLGEDGVPPEHEADKDEKQSGHGNLQEMDVEDLWTTRATAAVVALPVAT